MGRFIIIRFNIRLLTLEKLFKIKADLDIFFLILQPEEMLKLFWNSNKSQPLYACKRYAYKKSITSYFGGVKLKTNLLH